MGPTQEDVARRAEVSRALVSLVMRDSPRVSPESRRKILAAAAELGYRPNAYARSLASKRVRTIGVLVNDIANPYFAGLYASLAGAAADAGYDILTAPGTREAQSEAALVSTLLEHRVAGLALLSPLMKTSELRRIGASSPTVIVGREVAVAGLDVVTTDELQAARAAVGHLVRLGHRRIAHITGGANRPAKDRAAGYRSAMGEQGLRVCEVPGAFTERGGQAGAHALLTLATRPTAVMAANDLVAVGVMGVLRSAGLRVPEDVSVVGFDDSQIAQLDLVRLTSIRQPIDRFGVTAMATLMQRIGSHQRRRSVQRLETVLVERSTTGPVANGS